MSLVSTFFWNTVHISKSCSFGLVQFEYCSVDMAAASIYEFRKDRNIERTRLMELFGVIGCCEM